MLIFLLALFAVFGILEAVSLRQRPGKIEYDCSPSALIAEPDEIFEVVTVLKNKSRAPFNYVRLVESLPTELKIEEQSGKGILLREGASEDRPDKKMTSSAYLLPRQRLERRMRASLPQRGRYFFRGAFIHVGDLIGIRENTERVYQHKDIVILPRRAEGRDLDRVLGGFLGDVSVTRFIHEDPVLVLGFREYTGREPMKSIAWSRTAQSGRMMVKSHDHTLEPSVTVVLNTEGASRDAAERCFSLARTVCETLEDKAVQYSFVTNATTSNALGLWSEMPEGLGRAHLMSILEGLGRAGYDITEPISLTFEKLMKNANQGRSHILITPENSDELSRLCDRLGAISGGAVCVLEAGA